MCEKCINCNEPSEFIDSETDLCLECLADYYTPEVCESLALAYVSNCELGNSIPF
jgi:hypothetical protein